MLIEWARTWRKITSSYEHIGRKIRGKAKIERKFPVKTLRKRIRGVHFVKCVFVVLGYGLDDRRFESRQRLGIFLFTTAFRPVLGRTQPPIQWEPEPLSMGIRRPGREADHSRPSSAEVKNVWSYTSTPPICLHGVVLS
jgi:hypothetical protein